MKQLILLLGTTLYVLTAGDAVELLKNPGFEQGTSDWQHTGFIMQADFTHVHSGISSVKCSGRSKTYHGPSQQVFIKPGGRYAFQAYIQMINGVDVKPYEKVYVKIRFTWKDDDALVKPNPPGSRTYFAVASRPNLSSANGWTLIGSDFACPNREYSEALVYVEGLSPAVEYYLDDASLKEIPENTNWESEANARIEQLRKSNLHLTFNIGTNFDHKDLMVQLDLSKHQFGFGSLVRAENMIDPGFAQYQNIVYYMFNWATLQDYKWTYNRGNRTNPDYSTAVKATDELVKHGLKVRGHCMFWAVDGHIPDYVDSLSTTELKSEVENHIKYMTSITKGKLSHWDVNNELVHGNYFERKTNDPDFTKHMFQSVHAQDPTPKLFLNEYNVVSRGESTVSYLEQIQDFKKANVGLGGVGVQSHFPELTEPDTILMKYRLDVLGQAGLPIFVTELDISSHNETLRADWFEKALRLYFSHPAVHGIVFWGFWDHNQDPKKVMVYGYTFNLAEAGKRFLQLTKQEWSTHVNQSLAFSNSFGVRGFKGLYDLTVWYKGKPIKHRTLTLGNTDKNLTIGIFGDGKPKKQIHMPGEIKLPVKVDPFVSVPIDSGMSSQHLRTFGQDSSSSQETTLKCTNRKSGVSVVGDDNYVEISCQDGEVLTGCSSVMVNNNWRRDGEQILMMNGKPVCRAADGYLARAGVQAHATCCSQQGLTCTYRTAGPSGSGVDDQVIVPCPTGTYPLGCSTWTWASHSDGSYFTNNSCISQNDDPQIGVHSYAACCSGLSGQCRTVYSQTSGQAIGDKATINCPDGHVMTGCNVFSKYARAAGAKITVTNGATLCNAINGFARYGSETGVQAIATCCPGA